MSGLPGQLNDDEEGGQEESSSPRKNVEKLKLGLPGETGEGPSVHFELTPVNMPLHMTDSEVVKNRLLEKGGVELNHKEDDSREGESTMRKRTRKLSIGGARMVYQEEEKKEDRPAGKSRLSWKDEEDAKKNMKDISSSPGSTGLGGLRTAGSVRRLTKNQSYRLEKYGTVLPVSGKEAKARTSVKSGIGVVKEDGEEESVESPTTQENKKLRLYSFKSQSSMREKNRQQQRKGSVIGRTLSIAVKRVTVVANAMNFMGKRRETGDSARRHSDLRRAQEEAWQKLLNDHLENSEPQLRRFLRWKEDYAYFLKKHHRGEDKFNEHSLDPILMKRGKCTCPLSKQSCGAMDPYEYIVHCARCKEELPPFADQMVAMSTAIGEPDSHVAHRNALGLEVEEERDMLAAQEMYIEDFEEDRMSIAEGRSVFGGKLKTHRHHQKDSARRSVQRRSMRASTHKN
mmetsp:Transcript_20180/g.42257  ORF Transcript_20180/g.42257 Transcript_20180/m.42257 type:complete len:457 (+) Transcript_20180:220-1590(+)